MDKIIYNFDCICREDFIKNIIVSERDYITSFLNYIRRPFGPLSPLSLGYAQTLPGNIEQKIGCDGVIVIRLQTGIKIGVFEAKIIKPRWDSAVGPHPKLSRFGRQVNNQSKINPSFAIWEMFLNRNTNEPYMDTLGSTCVKYDIASKNNPMSKRYWNIADLKNLLQISYTANAKKPINIAQIIEEMCSCKFGALLPQSEDISFYNDSMEISKVPIINGDITLDTVRSIDSFLKSNNIFSYTYIDLHHYTSINRERIFNSLKI